MNNIQKEDRIKVLNQHKNALWNSIRRFEGESKKDHPNDPTGKETMENKVKALHEELAKADKELAELKK